MFTAIFLFSMFLKMLDFNRFLLYICTIFVPRAKRGQCAPYALKFQEKEEKCHSNRDYLFVLVMIQLYSSGQMLFRKKIILS